MQYLSLFLTKLRKLIRNLLSLLATLLIITPTKLLGKTHGVTAISRLHHHLPTVVPLPNSRPTEEVAMAVAHLTHHPRTIPMVEVLPLILPRNNHNIVVVVMTKIVAMELPLLTNKDLHHRCLKRNPVCPLV